MSITEILKSVDKNKENEDWVDTHELGYELGLDNVPYIEQEMIKNYWIKKWYCTDSMVGYRLYTFDDMPCAISVQKHRKALETFKWFNEESGLLVKRYLITLLENEKDYINVETIDENLNLKDILKAFQ